MLPLLPIFGFLFLLMLIYNYLIYPVFVSPLAKVPNAHFSAAISSLWIRSKRRNGKTGINATFAAHTKYGPVAQLSPNEVSAMSLDGLRKVYTGGFEKDDFYLDLKNYNTPNLVSLLENKPHSIQKRMLSHVYSKSYIHNSEDLQTLSRVLIGRLLPTLQDASDSGVDFDAYSLNHALGADFTIAFLFGSANGTDFIRDVPRREEFVKQFRIKYQELPGKEEATEFLEAFVLSLCRSADALTSPPLQGTGPVVYSQLSSCLEKKNFPSSTPAQLIAASEMMDHMAAGIETSRITLTYVQWELSHRPELAAALRKELRGLSPQIKHNPHGEQPATLPDSKALDALPLLNAILKEALRLYTPSPALLPRITPPSGTVVDGYVIPGGIKIGISGYCMHRNENVFPDPESFKPERWLENDTSGVDGGAGARTDMNRWFWAFGSGGRMCIGSHYAVYSLKLCIAAIYTDYSTSVVDDHGIEQKDTFLAGPVGEKLVLKLSKMP